MAPSKKLKILFIASELYPFVKTGGVADVSAALPQKLTEIGHEVRIIVPKYGAIDSRKYKIHDVVRLKDLSVDIAGREVVFSVRSSFLPSPKVRVQIYFLDNHEYFGSRKSLYYDPLVGKNYPDNDERFIFFSKSVFSLLQKLGWTPDIIHVNDWQCGLIPVYLKTMYANDPLLSHFRVLYTIHNFSEQEVFPAASFAKTGLDKKYGSEKYLLHNNKLNFVKGGVLFADAVNTVSDGYVKQVLKEDEITDGLKPFLAKRKNDFYGVLNGIDDQVWNPERDKYIPKKYSIKNIENKTANKELLLERFGLQFREDVPVIGVISRLSDFKGMDLITQSFPELMKMDIQLILLGTGDRKYHQAFEKLASKYPDKFACFLGFSDELAHLIEAGTDMFLMPSKYEPCGLNQMYSLAYGSVPIVRETGGLADTVIKFNPKTNEGTGFVFKEYTTDALVKEVQRAVKVFHDQGTWQKIMRNGMRVDFTWQSSAKMYVDLYKKVLSNKE